MIYVINESNKHLELVATKDADGVVTLSVRTEEKILNIVATKDERISSALLEKYENGEAIKNKSSRHSIKLNDARPYFKWVDALTLEMVSVGADDKLPEKYTLSKDAIVVVHTADTEVSMDPKNLLSEGRYSVRSEDLTASVFPIKWYNWSKLKETVAINVRGEAEWVLSTAPSKFTPSKNVNVVKSLKPRKPKTGKKKSDK